MVINKLDPRGYDLRVGGDFQCEVPETATLNLELEAGSHSMRLSLPGLITNVEKRYFRQSTGQGAVPMRVKAGGDIHIEAPSLRGQTKERFSPDKGLGGLESLDDLGERISRQVEQGLRTADFSARLTSEMTQRTEAITQRALQQAQTRIQAALQWLEQPGNPESGTQPAGTSIPLEDLESTPVSVQDDAHDPVSDEERMIILQMLEEKKISVDEAERLLDALEGGHAAG
jgi:hypothetical protein